MPLKSSERGHGALICMMGEDRVSVNHVFLGKPTCFPFKGDVNI